MVIGESRSELISWLNSVFGLDCSKVEHCGTGAVYCQIVDSIYGGVPMAKVKFGFPISEYDARNNMKVLQGAFNRHNITRQVDTERLIKCRLQDNLELLQWLKRHWSENTGVGVVYDAPMRRRNNATTPLPGNQSERTSVNSSRRTTVNGTSSSTNTNTNTPGFKPRVANQNNGGNSSQPLHVPKQRGSSSGKQTASHRVMSDSRVSSVDVDALTADLADMTQQLKLAQDQNAECKMMMESLESERNFFYSKLREIEILTRGLQDELKNDDSECKELTVGDLVGKVQDILYQSEEGFCAQDNDNFDAESF